MKAALFPVLFIVFIMSPIAVTAIHAVAIKCRSQVIRFSVQFELDLIYFVTVLDVFAPASQFEAMARDDSHRPSKQTSLFEQKPVKVRAHRQFKGSYEIR